MLEDLKNELAELAAQLDRLKKIDAMLTSLRSEARELYERERELKTVLSGEEADVERLEKTTVASIFYSILGRKDAQLDKEQQEAYAAKLKYDAMVRQLDDCRGRIDALELEGASLAGCGSRYEQVFGEIRELLRDDPNHAEKLCSLERQLGEAVSQLREADEAISAGNAALRQIESIENSLGSAENWGTWDLLGGGLISDLAKHSRLDEAQAGAEHLQVLLSRFRTELADVRISPQMGAVNVDGFLRFADYFFDGLIADWTVLSRIHDSQESVSRVGGQVSGALSRLASIKSARAAEKASLERQISELVMNA